MKTGRKNKTKIKFESSPARNDVYALFARTGKPLGFLDVAEALPHHGDADLSDALFELFSEGLIAEKKGAFRLRQKQEQEPLMPAGYGRESRAPRGRRDKRGPAEKRGKDKAENPDGSFKATVRMNARGAFVTAPDGTDVELTAWQADTLMPGDTVSVTVRPPHKKFGRAKAIARTVTLVSRGTVSIAGQLDGSLDKFWFYPDDARVKHCFEVSGNPVGQDGDWVDAEIVRYPDKDSIGAVRVLSVIGNIDTPGIETALATRRFRLPDVFPEAVLKEAASFGSRVPEEAAQGRKDLRDLPFVTIDGEDSRDFDDAVYCTDETDGRKRLYVAIADVSAYVRPETALDGEALKRATSVYFPAGVIPMLPEALSNGLCSLNPGEDRLALVCEALVSPDAQVLSYRFYEAVMRSHARLTYTEAQRMTESGESERGRDVLENVLCLGSLYRIFLSARKERGAIDFEAAETKAVFAPDGKAVAFETRERLDSHRLIEEMMLCANTCAADLVLSSGHRSLYRVHGEPDDEKIESLRQVLGAHAVKLPGGKSPSSGDFAAVIEHVKTLPASAMLQTEVLRSMKQAVYTPDNDGHFGLAYDAYTHFTSPIRRYPDLLVHRTIKAVLSGRAYEPAWGVREIGRLAGNSAQAPSFDRGGPSDVWDALGRHCSLCERRAESASRDALAWLKCRYLWDYVGDVFAAKATSVTHFGAFAEINEIHIEGLMPISSFGEYYDYNELKRELTGESSRAKIAAGTAIDVQVVQVDLQSRQVTFEAVNWPPVRRKERSPAKRKKATP